MYFAELEEFITEIVVRSKTEYDSPDKLTGGSPYEQVFQDEDALIALYDIEPGIKFPHVNAFFSADLQDRDEDASGWIFARGGDALIAYYPMAPYTWEPITDVWDSTMVHQRLVSPHLKNGAVVQLSPASAYASFDAFKAAVRALPLETSTEPVPSVRFTALNGHAPRRHLRRDADDRRDAGGLRGLAALRRSVHARRARQPHARAPLRPDAPPPRLQHAHHQRVGRHARTTTSQSQP